MPLALRLISVAFLVFVLLGKRWAYAGFLLSSFLYFPARAGFHFQTFACETLVSSSLALYSFRNYPHEILFALFFVLSVFHCTRDVSTSWRGVLIRSLIGSLMLGAIIELGEGISGHGHCRLRDLLPDSLGIVVGLLIVLAFRAARRTTRLSPTTPMKHR